MFGIILSSIAAISLLGIGGYAVAKQRTAANTLFALVAVLLAGIELADQLSLHAAVDPDLFRPVSRYLDAILPAVLMMFSLAYGRTLFPDFRSKVRFALLTAMSILPLAILFAVGDDLYYSPDFLNEHILFLGDAGYWFSIVIMTLLIAALVNVEATFVATRGVARNRMKFEAFGIMGLLAVMIFYYSQGLLYRTINMNLLPVRSSVLILSTLMIGYSRLARGSGAPVIVSRHVLFRSITLLAVGLYLLGLGLVGEGMRYFGIEFGRNLTIIVGFAGGLLLLLILFPENMRRRVKVFVNKHFYENKHDYRYEWIKFTTRLATCGTLAEVQDTVLTIYRDTFGLAGASLYLLSRDERRYLRVAEQFMVDGSAELCLPEGLNDYFTKRERILEVGGGEYPLSVEGKALFGRGKTWLVVPLISSGRIEGLLMLREQIVPEQLTYDDFDLMKVMARQAGQAITNLRLSEEIMEMRAMAAVSRISTFVIHDLKNLMSGLSLVVDNAAEHINDPDFQQDAISTVKNTLAKMKNLIQRLKTIPEKGALATAIEDIGRLSQEIVKDFESLRTGKRVQHLGDAVLARVDGEEIRKVIVNLVQNALEAGGDSGTVSVETLRTNDSACIRVSDTGGGMTDEFLKNQLFRPFCSTKDKGLGIGLYQCRQIVEAHGGRIDVVSEVGKGTVFTVVLPAVEPDRKENDGVTAESEESAQF